MTNVDYTKIIADLIKTDKKLNRQLNKNKTADKVWQIIIDKPYELVEYRIMVKILDANLLPRI